MMKRALVFLVGFVFLIACKPERKNDFNFLIGSWKMKTNDSTYILETWTKTDENNYEGLAYNVSPMGMELSEELKLEIKGNEIYYIPILKNSDKNKPIKFKLVSNENDIYHFENKENDFPTIISYQSISDSIMHASLIDSIGKVRMTFKYKKVKE